MDLEQPSPQIGVGRWPGIKGAHAALNRLGCLCPINSPILFFEHRRVTGLVVVLSLGRNGASFEVLDRLQQQARADRAELGFQGGSGFVDR